MVEILVVSHLALFLSWGSNVGITKTAPFKNYNTV